MKSKVIILSILLFGWNINLHAQNYISIFGVESTKWYQAREIIDFVEPVIIETGNDTLINMLPYTKILVSSGVIYISYYLREDTVEGKVWIYDNDDSTEYLIMDLSLNVGDTFRMSTVYNYQDSLAVVNSITFENGRKIVELGYELIIYPNVNQLKFIEGVGPTAGLLYQLSSIDDNIVNNNLLLCTYKDGSQDYYLDEPYNNNCYYVGGAGLFGNSNKVLSKIYPNPANNEINVEFEENYTGNIKVFNILGQLMNRFEMENANKIVLGINDLTTGMYFISLSNSTSILIGKFYKK